jgi:hypothetical protein
MTKRDADALADFIACLQNAYLKGRMQADDLLPTLAVDFAEEMKIRDSRFNDTTFLQRCCI